MIGLVNTGTNRCLVNPPGNTLVLPGDQIVMMRPTWYTEEEFQPLELPMTCEPGTHHGNRCLSFGWSWSPKSCVACKKRVPSVLAHGATPCQKAGESRRGDIILILCWCSERLLSFENPRTKQPAQRLPHTGQAPPTPLPTTITTPYKCASTYQSEYQFPS